MGLDQKLQYNHRHLLAVGHIGSPPCQLLARHESESGCLLAVEIGRTWQDCAFLAHIASIMAISHLSQSFTEPLLLHKETLMVSL